MGDGANFPLVAYNGDMRTSLFYRVAIWGTVLVALIAIACMHEQSNAEPAADSAGGLTVWDGSAPLDTVVFAGGCFWSMQKAFDHVDGVVGTMAGYAGGSVPNPSYEQVETGETGHAESVRVIYEPGKISYANLINAYFHRIDPTDGDGTFCDRGPQYRPVIFVRDSVHRGVAESQKAALAKVFSKPIAVQIVTSSAFYPAEDYHQEYYKKNPRRYDMYRIGCGRDAALDVAWKGKVFPATH